MKLPNYKTMKLRNNVLLFIFISFVGMVSCNEVCEKKLHNCTSMMQPVLNEVRYMFPISQQEIDGMCQVWSHIMDCVRKYVTDCSTEEQRNRFNEAVSNSIDSVHAICSSDRYRRDYLEYAKCFRKVSVDGCGHNFRKLVDSAYNPHSLEKHICCAYREYEKCVFDPVQRMCGPHALRILDDSMISLKSRCEAVSRSLKQSDKICPADVPIQESNDYTLQRPSLRHVEDTYEQVSTPDFLPSSKPMVYTTPSWTKRPTIIYPLPVTRHSRMYRNTGWTNQSSKLEIIMFTIAVVAFSML